MAIVKGEGGIFCGQEIVSSNPVSRITLLIYRGEASILIFEDPKGAGARSIYGDMIEFPTVVVVESECAIAGRCKIIPSDTMSGVPLTVNRREVAIFVFQDEDGTIPWPIQHNVVQLPTMVVVECKKPYLLETSNHILQYLALGPPGCRQEKRCLKMKMAPLPGRYSTMWSRFPL
jgi:hypothetical protein